MVFRSRSTSNTNAADCRTREHLDPSPANRQPARISPIRFDSGGSTLLGQLIEPSKVSPRGSILICNATGVPARFYVAFARWLAETQDRIVLVWDYRDFGASGDPRRSRATLSDWGVHDATQARKWLKRRFPELPLWIIGHSLGGLALPFQPDLHEISRVITVAAGPVHLSDHPTVYKVLIGSLWYGHGPVLTKLLGHFPGRYLGLGADIPGPAYWQWRRWCSRRGSVAVDPSAPPLSGKDLKAPVTLIAFSDDGLVPPSAVWRLAEWLPRAEVERRLIDPRDHGIPRIGHVAAFSLRNHRIWPVMVAE